MNHLSMCEIDLTEFCLEIKTIKCINEEIENLELEHEKPKSPTWHELDIDFNIVYTCVGTKLWQIWHKVLVF